MNNQQNSKLNLHNTIASRIKQRLIDLDMQQKDIIDALGVPKSTVSEWVKKNEKRTPNTEYLIELSRCLKCSVDYLVGITEASTPLRSEEQQILRLVCDYTGLDEQSIRILNTNINNIPHLATVLNFTNNAIHYMQGFAFKIADYEFDKNYIIRHKPPVNKDDLINSENDEFFDEIMSKLPQDIYSDFQLQKYLIFSAFNDFLNSSDAEKIIDEWADFNQL